MNKIILPFAVSVVSMLTPCPFALARFGETVQQVASDGVNYEAFTAWLTLAAVLTALFWSPVQNWWRRPKLKLGIRKRDAVRERLETGLHAIPRLYVYNDGRGVATNVRVTLATIFVKTAKGFEIYDQPVSTDLQWAEENNERLLGMLPSKASRLVSLGVLSKIEINGMMKHFLVVEISGGGQLQIAEGDYVFRVIVSGENFQTRALLVRIELGPRRPGETFWFSLLWPDVATQECVARIEKDSRLHASLR